MACWVYAALLVVNVCLLRRPIVRTVDCWSIGWDGGGVRRVIVMIHVFSPSVSLLYCPLDFLRFLPTLSSACVCV